MSRHRFHGDPQRFSVLAAFIYERWGTQIKYVADVAGGQGMLSRVLRNKYHYDSEVIDPRGHVLRGVPSRVEDFDPNLASYYDLVIGLHADQATRAVAEAGLERRSILVPCCNFWSKQKLGQYELIEAIEEHYRQHHVPFERVTFEFRGPKNIGIVTEP